MTTQAANGDQAMQSTETEVNDNNGYSHSELKKYIETNVSVVYTAVTGKTLHRNDRVRRYAPPVDCPISISTSFSSASKIWIAFVVCDKKTFVEGRGADNLTQALLNLLEATSELLHMWRNGPLHEGDLGVCSLRESGGQYWNGQQRDRKGYRSTSS